MLISKTSRYALQATTFLAGRYETGESAQAQEIAEEIGVPRNYLAKILHQLARSGVLVSERGRNGGFRLARHPAETPLAVVVEPVEPGLGSRHCLLGRDACSDDDPCPAHADWKRLSEEMDRFLAETTLADLARIDPTAGAAARSRKDGPA